MSVSPDEGMMLLRQRMAARQEARAAVPPSQLEDGPAGPGLDFAAAFGVMARATTAIEAVAARGELPRRLHWDMVHPVEPPGAASPAAGTLDDPDRWGPREKWAWQVFGVFAELGAGATGWSAWLDSPGDPTNLVYTAAASGRWEPSDFILLPGRRLVFTSAGGGLTISKWQAAEIAVDYLPTYLGLRP